MFFIASIKKYLIMAAVIGIAGFGVWKFYQYKEAQLQTAILEADRAKAAQQETQAAIESMTKDLEIVREQYDDVSRQFDEAEGRVEELERRLSEHDLGYLAQEKPGLVEPILNNATRDMNRCLEIASGAPLTEEEINATKKSEANSICPGLANPSYRP